MQAAGTDISRRRITLILDISSSNQLLLEMLPSLFDESAGIDIDAVFVEEPAQRRAAELPFVREFCLLTTVEREFGPMDLKRAIEVRKQRLSKLMAAAVGRPGVECSIRSVHSAANLLQELVSVSDITMIVPLRRLRQQFVTWPVTHLQRRGRVVVAIGEWSSAREPLLTGLRLAGGDPQRIAVLVTGEAAATESMDCASRITALLSAAPASIRIVSEQSVQALVNAVLLERPGTFVLGAMPEWLDSNAIRTLREQLGCMICLVRAKLEVPVQDQ